MQYRKQRLIKEITYHVRTWMCANQTRPCLRADVQLTDVVIANDLSYVKLYVHWQDQSRHQFFQEILDASAPEIRKLIAMKIPFKKAPKFMFYYDKGEDKVQSLRLVMAKIDRVAGNDGFSEDNDGVSEASQD